MLMNFDAMMHIFCVRKNISRLINKTMIKMNVFSASDFFFLKLEAVYFQPPRQTPLSNLFTSKVSKYAWLSVLLILRGKTHMLLVTHEV